ncbi:MAG: peptide deformylase [Gemmatimonadetes bacterium]|nr:peptide deformylase [Gemmatimonadota bacterium]
MSDATCPAAILPLRFLGDPVLRSKASRVDAFDADLRTLAESMVASMYAHHGIGLAAPQVGRPIRLIVVDTGEQRDGSEAFALVNPEIVEQEGAVTGEEGCLSIPGIVAEVERSSRVRVRGSTPAGEPLEIVATELLARVLQHEIDHLNGILFVDRLGPMRRRMALREWRRRRTRDEPAAPAAGA